MKKMVLRTGGFSFWLYLLVDLAGIAVFVWDWDTFLLAFYQQPNTLHIFTQLMFLWLIGYITASFFVNKITLTGETLSIRSLSERPFLPGKIRTTNRIELDDIAAIYIGKEGYVREFLQDNPNWEPESDQFYMRFGGRRQRPGAAGPQIGYRDIMVIAEKSGQLTFVSTKPFSAAGFRRLIAALREDRVEVFVGSKVLNKNQKSS
jgi:hypothetical protein